MCFAYELHQSNRKDAPWQNLIFTWWVCGGTGCSTLKVFRRTEQRSLLQEESSFPQEQGFAHRPKQVESVFKSAAELLKVIGGNRATTFWLYNPFPKHSHTTVLFQSSLSRNTSHGAALRAGHLNQLSLCLAQPLTQNQTSLPMPSPCTFTQHS